MHCFSLVVCRHPETKKWLAVEEIKNRGWWLPGGFCECGDNFETTAHKETLEEAGIDIVLKGILRVENNMNTKGGRQRVIYYAEPKDPQQPPKSEPDKESMGAAWLTVPEMLEKYKLPKAEGGLRGTELLDWATYIENDGTIFPLEIFASEYSPVPSGKGNDEEERIDEHHIATIPERNMNSADVSFLESLHKANEKLDA